MMRTMLALAAALVATPAAADPAPMRGDYCAAGDMISVGTIPDVPLGIDGLDCHDVRYDRGRAVAPRCYSNGGHASRQDLDLAVLPDGSIRHDGRVYRRRAGPLVPGRPPCG